MEPPSCSAESVYEVIFQKPIPAQIRQFILYIGNDDGSVCGNLLMQNDFTDNVCDFNMILAESVQLQTPMTRGAHSCWC